MPRLSINGAEIFYETHGDGPETIVFAHGLLLDKNPFFRLHPHPMTANFPIVFMLAAPFFLALFLLEGFIFFSRRCLALEMV